MHIARPESSRLRETPGCRFRTCVVFSIKTTDSIKKPSLREGLNYISWRIKDCLFSPLFFCRLFWFSLSQVQVLFLQKLLLSLLLPF
jgi:hypothetical protein